MAKEIVFIFLRKTIALLYRVIVLLEKRSFDEYRNLYRVMLKNFILENLNIVSGVEVLDVGSGDWSWVKDELTRRNFHVLCFDKRPSINVDVVGDAYELYNFFGKEQFDLVVCTDVLEHSDNPARLLNSISCVLKTGGIVMISCPFDKELHGEEYGDYWRITRQGWQVLLKNDFKDIAVEWWGPENKPKAYFIKAFKK